jgi:alpha-galactosidase
VLNRGWIDNLPNACVQVECLVNRGSLHPVHFGSLPEQLAALNRPLTAAVCSLEEIDRLFEEMWEAERSSLLAFG